MLATVAIDPNTMTEAIFTARTYMLMLQTLTKSSSNQVADPGG